jgi:hypothetical protein
MYGSRLMDFYYIVMWMLNRIPRHTGREIEIYVFFWKPKKK